MRDNYLEEYYSFLRFPSVSTDDKHKEKLVECANWLVNKLNRIGLQTQLVPTKRHPIVWARNEHRPGRPTVMIYGHYDVQPPDPLELWDSPPFEPVLKNGYVFARGSTDNKGQILAHILGIQETIEEHRELPVNLHLVIEGEEEIGSANLGPFLSQNRDALKCDVAVISDTGMIARGMPTLSYGLRGVTALEVKVTGPKMDLHSGVFGGAVANPITALAQLLATLHDRDGRVAIAGFYDRVKPLEDWEREAWRKLPVDGDKLIREETGVPELFGEAGYNSVERIWARPTAEINGIGGGYQGQGTKTVIAEPRVCETDVPSRSRTERRRNSGTGENAFGKKSAQRRYDGSYHSATAARGISQIRIPRWAKRHNALCAKLSTATPRSSAKGAASRSSPSSGKFSASKRCSWDSPCPIAAHIRLTKIFLSKISRAAFV